MIGFTIRTIAKILTYILALITFCAAWGGYVPPQIWSTPQLLTLAYPYLAIATLIAGVIWLLCRRFIPAIVCAAALIGGSTTLLTNLPLGSEKKTHPGEKSFTVMTYNILRGIDQKGRPSETNLTFQYIMDTGADMVCIQELNSLSEAPRMTEALLDSLKKAYPYQIFDSATDLGLLSKYPATSVAHTNGSTYLDIYEQYEVNIDGFRLNLLNVHLASYLLSDDERNVVTDIHDTRSARQSIAEFKGSIMSKMKDSYVHRASDAELVRNIINRISGPLIVCGDFNDVPASWAYRVIRGDDLKDAYTDTGLGMRITYNSHWFYFHIDQILYRPDKLRALSVKKGDVDYSDHYPQTALFAFTP